MSGVGRISERVLRLAGSESLPARSGQCGPVGDPECDPQGERRHVGLPRMHGELPGRGVQASLNRVAGLMWAAGMQGVSRRRVVRTTWRNQEDGPAGDLVNRRFTATGPNQLWVADITYVPTWAGSCTWRWDWMSGTAGSWDGRFRPTCEPSLCLRPCIWHWSSENRRVNRPGTFL